MSINHYATNFYKKISSEIDTNNVTGDKLLNITQCNHINLFIIKKIYDDWLNNFNKNKIPFFDYDNKETKEAQKNIGSFVPQKIIEYINSGNSSNSVNFPNLYLPKQKEAHRFIHIHKNEPGIMLKINKILDSFDIFLYLKKFKLIVNKPEKINISKIFVALAECLSDEKGSG